jgi:hypothetical protein
MWRKSAVETVNTLDNDMSGKEDQSHGGNVHLQEKGSTILAPSESPSKQTCNSKILKIRI